MLIESIQNYLTNLQEERKPQISISNMGQCLRKSFYIHNNFPRKKTSWKSKMIFEDGKTGHDSIRALLREAGPKSDPPFQLTMEEKEVELKIHGMVIKGHIDGVICTGEDHSNDALFEFKTMSSFPFERFEQGEALDRAYIVQMQAYMCALQVKRCLYLVKNKDNAALCQREFVYDPGILDDLVPKLAASLKEEPQREYGFDLRGNLDWHCGYCDYRDICWAGVGMKEIRFGKFVKA